MFHGVPKARAARATDQADIARLAKLTGVTTVEAIAEVVAELFPGEPLSARGRKVLEDIFREGL